MLYQSSSGEWCCSDYVPGMPDINLGPTPPSNLKSNDSDKEAANKSASIPDPCDIPEEIRAATQLRLMMNDAKPEERCVLCKAAELLEKKQDKNSDFMWPLLLSLIMFGYGSMSNINLDMLKAALDIQSPSARWIPKETSNEHSTG